MYVNNKKLLNFLYLMYINFVGKVNYVDRYRSKLKSFCEFQKLNVIIIKYNNYLL